MAGVRRLSWLHISDLHIDTRGITDKRVAQDQEVCWKGLIEDIAEFRANAGQPGKPVQSPDLMILSGDIVQRGSQGDAFAVARELVERLRKAAGVPPKRVFVIPGNHDIARNRLGRNHATQLDFSTLDTGTFRQAVDTIWNAANTLEAIDRKFLNYREFAMQYAPVTLGPLGAWRIRTTISELVVEIVGLNSVWTGGSPELDRPGMPVIGRSQRLAIDEQCSGSAKADLTFVLQHTPTSYLHAVDSLDHASWLDDRDAIVLCGHLHQSEMAERRSVRGRHLELLGGALYPGYSDDRRYSLGTVEVASDERKFAIALRSSSPDSDFFAADTGRYRAAPEGFVQFAQDISQPSTLGQRARANDQLTIDVERASLRYDSGKYYVTIQKTYRNPTARTWSHIEAHVFMMAYPGDFVRSREVYTKHPLDLREIKFAARCNGKKMKYILTEEHPSRKDINVVLGNPANDEGLRPGETATIDYSFEVERPYWGPFFERHMRFETTELTCVLDFPQRVLKEFKLVLNPWITATDLTDEVDVDESNDRIIYSWSRRGPRLQSRYRFEWTFLSGNKKAHRR
jgi:3',5'-cyclic AMP phosphodiesterase CpdA